MTSFPDYAGILNHPLEQRIGNITKLERRGVFRERLSVEGVGEPTIEQGKHDESQLKRKTYFRSASLSRLHWLAARSCAFSAVRSCRLLMTDTRSMGWFRFLKYMR